MDLGFLAEGSGSNQFMIDFGHKGVDLTFNSLVVTPLHLCKDVGSTVQVYRQNVLICYGLLLAIPYYSRLRTKGDRQF